MPWRLLDGHRQLTCSASSHPWPVACWAARRWHDFGCGYAKAPARCCAFRGLDFPAEVPRQRNGRRWNTVEYTAW